MKSQLNNLVQLPESEVRLFRKMSQILSTHYNVAFIEEIHKRSVHYTSATIAANAVRELGDLWIIAYSPRRKRAKMTFLQAKYDRRQLPALTTFSGDYFQYELLSKRPRLTNGGTFNFPGDILSFSCCSSVGCYGIFYHDLNNDIELAYCSAALLSVSSPIPTSYGQHAVDLDFPSVPQGVHGCNCHTCRELNMTGGIDDFTTNLLQLHIGADIHLYRHILQYLKTILGRIPQVGAAITQLSEFIHDSERRFPPTGGDDTGFPEGEAPVPGTLLIINVDPKEAG